MGGRQGTPSQYPLAGPVLQIEVLRMHSVVASRLKGAISAIIAHTSTIVLAALFLFTLIVGYFAEAALASICALEAMFLLLAVLVTSGLEPFLIARVGIDRHLGIDICDVDTARPGSAEEAMHAQLGTLPSPVRLAPSSSRDDMADALGKAHALR
jgi:hypothetical protein